ncbi:uncharacterized protein LOC144547521 [Carex rostrata]
MLLMKMLCPVEKTIYPGWNNDKEDVIRPTVEPTKSISMDFDWIEEEREVEAKLRHKGNKRGNMESDTEATFHEFSDSNEEPIMDEIPVEVLGRPPSLYKDRLIRELKRPFDKCEYRELMKKAAFRSKKIVIKELRPVKNAVKTKSAGKVRERAIETEDASNSFFNWYPEVETKVKRARIGRRLTLLRGFFFWLQNCGWEESFKPWQKGRKGSKVDLCNDSVRPE